MKLAKEIYVAAKTGGGDPASNPALRLVIEKAKAANMPNENIERAIKKATGTQEHTNYEEVRYEGYGPGGVAVMVVCLTEKDFLSLPAKDLTSMKMTCFFKRLKRERKKWKQPKIRLKFIQHRKHLKK
jgi:hypothetical protein